LPTVAAAAASEIAVLGTVVAGTTILKAVMVKAHAIGAGVLENAIS